MFDCPRVRGGSSVIILGIDPGLANTGWGVIERSGSRCRCLAYGCITTSPDNPLPARLSQVHDELVAVIGRYAPTEASVESVYFSTNAKTAFATGQARGAAVLALAGAGLELAEYGPGEIKLAVVGTGSAEKQQVQYMVRIVLGLPEDPHPDHAADALAAAICHAHRSGSASVGVDRARETAADTGANRKDGALPEAARSDVTS